jgi:hypothetical protein
MHHHMSWQIPPTNLKEYHYHVDNARWIYECQISKSCLSFHIFQINGVHLWCKFKGFYKFTMQKIHYTNFEWLKSSFEMQFYCYFLYHAFKKKGQFYFYILLLLCNLQPLFAGQKIIDFRCSVWKLEIL